MSSWRGCEGSYPTSLARAPALNEFGGKPSGARTDLLDAEAPDLVPVGPEVAHEAVAAGRVPEASLGDRLEPLLVHRDAGIELVVKRLEPERLLVQPTREGRWEERDGGGDGRCSGRAGRPRCEQRPVDEAMRERIVEREHLEMGPLLGREGWWPVWDG